MTLDREVTRVSPLTLSLAPALFVVAEEAVAMLTLLQAVMAVMVVA